MRHSMKPDLRDDYKIRLYTRPKNPFFEVSTLLSVAACVVISHILTRHPVGRKAARHGAMTMRLGSSREPSVKGVKKDVSWAASAKLAAHGKAKTAPNL